MKHSFKMAYLGARFNDDDAGESESGGNGSVDINSILSDQNLLNQVLEKAPQFQSLQSQAQTANEQLGELQKEKQRLEQEYKDKTFQSDTLNNIFGEAKDEAEAFQKVQAWAEERYSPVISQKEEKLSELENQLNEYKSKEQRQFKRDFFTQTAQEHKGLRKEGMDILFGQIENMIQTDAKGVAKYVDHNGMAILGTDGKAITTEEMLDNLSQQSNFSIFFQSAQSNGGYSNGSPGAAKRMTQSEYINAIFNASDGEEAELIKKKNNGEIVVV